MYNFQNLGYINYNFEFFKFLSFSRVWKRNIVTVNCDIIKSIILLNSKINILICLVRVSTI